MNPKTAASSILPAVHFPTTSMPQKSDDEQIWNAVFALFVIVLFWNLIPWLIVALLGYGGFKLYRWLCSDNSRPTSHDRKPPRCRRR